MFTISELRELLYKKYKRKEISKKMNLSPVQISRLLNNKSNMTLIQYTKFEGMIK